MKINQVQNSVNLYENNRKSLQTGNDFKKTLEIARESSDVRSDRVADIKKRMENGTYNVSAEDVARKILQRF